MPLRWPSPDDGRDLREKAGKIGGLASRANSRSGYSFARIATPEISEIFDAMRSGTVDCARGAAPMAETGARVDERIRSLRALSRLLAEEQERLEVSVARLRATGQRMIARAGFG